MYWPFVLCVVAVRFLARYWPSLYGRGGSSAAGTELPGRRDFGDRDGGGEGIIRRRAHRLSDYCARARLPRPVHGGGGGGAGGGSGGGPKGLPPADRSPFAAISRSGRALRVARAPTIAAVRRSPSRTRYTHTKPVRSAP